MPIGMAQKYLASEEPYDPERALTDEEDRKDRKDDEVSSGTCRWKLECVELQCKVWDLRARLGLAEERVIQRDLIIDRLLSTLKVITQGIKKDKERELVRGIEAGETAVALAQLLEKISQMKEKAEGGLGSL